MIKKRDVFVFILGLIVMGTISAVAYTYNAKDIVYTPSNSNWKVNNMKDALDSLKEEKIDTLEHNSMVTYQGYRYQNKTISKVLNRGKYVVVTIDSFAIGRVSDGVNYESDGYTSLTCSNSCNIVKLNNKYLSTIADYEFSDILEMGVYQVGITNETDTVLFRGQNNPSASNDGHSMIMEIEKIK